MALFFLLIYDILRMPLLKFSLQTVFVDKIEYFYPFLFLNNPLVTA